MAGVVTGSGSGTAQSATAPAAWRCGYGSEQRQAPQPVVSHGGVASPPSGGLAVVHS